MRENIHDEAFLDGLLHTVDVEGTTLDDAAFGIRCTENFQRFVLGRSRKGKVAGIGKHLSTFHVHIHKIFDAGLVVVLIFTGKSDVHFGRKVAALAGVRFVYDDGEGVAFMGTADFIKNERKFLDSRDDNFLARLNGTTQITGMLRPGDGTGNLHELPDGIAYLLVEVYAVGNNDNGGDKILSVFFQPHELMSKPGNGVRLAAACAVLNEVFLPHAMRPHIGQ